VPAAPALVEAAGAGRDVEVAQAAMSAAATGR
jgi:hypothetical protein